MMPVFVGSKPEIYDWLKLVCALGTFAKIKKLFACKWLCWCFLFFFMAQHLRSWLLAVTFHFYYFFFRLNAVIWLVHCMTDRLISTRPNCQSGDILKSNFNIYVMSCFLSFYLGFIFRRLSFYACFTPTTSCPAQQCPAPPLHRLT